MATAENHYAPKDSDVLQYGQVVCVKDLVNSPEFNGKWGTIESYITEKDRYTVRVEKMYPILSLKMNNLSLVNVNPSTDKHKYLEVWPVDSCKIMDKSQIPVTKVNGCVPRDLNDNESLEKAFLQSPRKFLINSKRNPWKNPQGLKAYSKNATYPDIYFYFDAADQKSQMNDFAASLSPYPEDIGSKFPSSGIRGSIVVVRQESPSAITGSPWTPCRFEESDTSQNMPGVFGIEEMQESLWYFHHEEDCKRNAKKRDIARCTGSMPPGLLEAMGNNFTHVKFP